MTTCTSPRPVVGLVAASRAIDRYKMGNMGKNDNSKNTARLRPLCLGVLLGAIGVTFVLICNSHFSERLQMAYTSSNFSLHLFPLTATGDDISYEPECLKPVKNVYYVKVHKTASSTMITILFGAARRHNMTTYPVSSDPYPGDMLSKGFKTPPEYPNIVYNLFGEHAIFDEDLAEEVMPEGTRYVATIRYPVAQIRSLFVEFGLTLRDNQGQTKSYTESADLYLTHPDKYQTVHYLKNFQARYLSFKSEENPQAFINRLEKKFSLIMIAEYFDESLVILRRKFCWRFQDIIYTILRQRKYKNKNSIPSDTQLANHQRVSPVDYEMYNYFVEQLMRNIAAHKESFHNELYVFKMIKENVYLFCDAVVDRLRSNSSAIRTMVANGEKEVYNPAPWGEPFSVTAVDCALMKLKTRVHRNIMKIRQFPTLCQYSRQPVSHVYMDITWDADGRHIKMHDAYCGSRGASGIPIDVLEIKESYMWT